VREKAAAACWNTVTALVAQLDLPGENSLKRDGEGIVAGRSGDVLNLILGLGVKRIRLGNDDTGCGDALRDESLLAASKCGAQEETPREGRRSRASYPKELFPE
jgi:hypothetical protein